ncbi:MAG: sel1 repeat family protein [Alphaproteobacteria bacterium]|nr:sel1 repeat family protein [Alphaproteobacteria bacterium]
MARGQTQTKTDDLTACRAAAEAGRPDALYRLGLFYSSGNGVPLDYVTAHKWLNIAAVRGSDDAKRLRRELAADMTREEIAEAQRQAREWISRH